MLLHVIDGTFELFRAHYSKRPDQRGADGRDVKATAGFVSSMLWLLGDPDVRATHVAVAFDNPIESFRNELFDGYKTGAGIEEALRAQFDLAEDAARALGLVVWSMDRWEADDALATAAARWGDQVEQVRILTPDKDLGQCVRGEHIVQVDVIRRRVIDEKAVRERRGVAPAAIPDFLALVGDTADGIPGLAGFGEKTAAKLLDRYGSIEAIPNSADDWDVQLRGAARLSDTLEKERERALLYKHLATLVLDVPLEEELSDLEWHGVREPEFEALCRDLDSPRLLDRARSLQR